MELILNPIPENLREEYDELIRDPWLSKKTNRAFRAQEKKEYIDCLIPEVKSGGKMVLDIGAGTGEFLEYCRLYDNKAIGMDDFDNSKKNLYSRFSKIQWARQDLDVRNYDFAELISRESSEFDDIKFNIINCQHAINFIFKNVFDFKETSTVYLNDGNWIFGKEFDDYFSKFFKWCSEHLATNGVLLVASLRSENRSQYSTIIDRLAVKYDLGLVMNKSFLIHKWRKL